MKRHILGVLAATIPAPYLLLFMWSVFDLIFGDEVGMKEPLDLIKVIPLGTLALLMLGLPLIVLASVFAALVNSVEHPTWRGSVFGGALLGFGFTAILFKGSFANDEKLWAYFFASVLSGAICGWIYWRIALSDAALKRR